MLFDHPLGLWVNAAVPYVTTVCNLNHYYYNIQIFCMHHKQNCLQGRKRHQKQLFIYHVTNMWTEDTSKILVLYTWLIFHISIIGNEIKEKKWVNNILENWMCNTRKIMFNVHRNKISKYILIWCIHYHSNSTHH